MIPIRDENPTINTSIMTYVIIGINVLVWIILQRFGSELYLARSICEFGLIPGELLERVRPGTSVPLARNFACVIEGKSNWFTVLSSMFMHGGWLHIIGNMWFLGIFGDNVEDAMGPFRFLIFYLLCGIVAAAAQVIANPSSPVPMVGASGAIGGVMGAYALLYPRAPVHMLIFFGFFFTRIVVPAFFMLGFWFLLQFLGGFMTMGTSEGGVAFWAHIGGFLAGIILIKIFCISDRLDVCKRKRGEVDRYFKRFSE